MYNKRWNTVFITLCIDRKNSKRRTTFFAFDYGDLSLSLCKIDQCLNIDDGQCPVYPNQTLITWSESLIQHWRKPNLFVNGTKQTDGQMLANHDLNARELRWGEGCGCVIASNFVRLLRVLYLNPIQYEPSSILLHAQFTHAIFRSGMVVLFMNANCKVCNHQGCIVTYASILLVSYSCNINQLCIIIQI